jgi:hypothetical protein
MWLLHVQWTGCAGAWSVKDVKVNHGGFDRGVAEEGLEGTDVGAILEEVGGKRMSEGVAGHAL